MDGDLRLKMPRFFKFERLRSIGMFMGGASQNAVARQRQSDNSLTSSEKFRRNRI